MNTVEAKVFQIHYLPEQAAKLDPAFQALDNAGQNDPFFEFGVFKRLSESPATQGANLWGAFSWKFGQKTGLTGAQLHEFIAANPGRDVYYCNHLPELEALFQNLWMHGETRHPGLLEVAQAVFIKAGLDPRLCHHVEPATLFATANFFVATPRFWEAYLTYVESVVLPALADPDLGPRVLSTQADPKGLHAGASYLPFIIERLFGAFLESDEGRSFSSIQYPVASEKYRLNPHLRRLHQMKQAAWQTRSSWMMQCWMGYRNLYLELMNGAEWAASHLPNISSEPISFSAPRPN